MNRAFASCFNFCPWAVFFFRRTNATVASPDDSYDAAPVKKPTIIINSMDAKPSMYINTQVQSSHFMPGPYFEENKENSRRLSTSSNRSPGELYAARVNFSTQYVSAKKTLILKVKDCTEMDLDCFDASIQSQIRVLVPCAKAPKMQTTYVAGFHPVFNECLIFTNVEENDFLVSKLRFRLYVRRGKSRPELLGEGEFRAKTNELEGAPLAHSLKLGGPKPEEEEEEKDEAPRIQRRFEPCPLATRQRKALKHSIQKKINKAISGTQPKPQQQAKTKLTTRVVLRFGCYAQRVVRVRIFSESAGCYWPKWPIGQA